MQDYLYKDYVKTLAEKFERRLQEITATYNFDLGPEFEIAICEILRSFLPSRYGICRGFVVNAAGQEAGDDIIIYDQERFPTLRLSAKDSFTLKERIPIEAVYAYIEAKHSLDEESFEKAIQQVIAVKNLCMQRKLVWIEQYDPYIEVPNSILPPFLPRYRNPTLGIILSRRVQLHGIPTSAPSEIRDFLALQIPTIDRHPRLPDLIVAGSSNILTPGINDETPTLFFIPGPTSSYRNVITENIALGVTLAHLLAALDWIRLGVMPWHDILNDAIVGEI